MSARPWVATTNETREQRIEAVMKELQPKIDAAVRKLVERAVDVPEAEEFGAIDFEFRDAGQQLVNDVAWLPISQNNRAELVKSNVQGYQINESGYAAPDVIQQMFISA